MYPDCSGAPCHAETCQDIWTMVTRKASSPSPTPVLLRCLADSFFLSIGKNGSKRRNPYAFVRKVATVGNRTHDLPVWQMKWANVCVGIWRTFVYRPCQYFLWGLLLAMTTTRISPFICRTRYRTCALFRSRGFNDFMGGCRVAQKSLDVLFKEEVHRSRYFGFLCSIASYGVVVLQPLGLGLGLGLGLA